MIEDLEGEIWKDVVGYEGFYKVSNKGRVKSLERQVLYSNGALRVHKSKNLMLVNVQGYLKVCLSKDKRIKNYFVHRLVAQAFLSNDENKPTVNHKDGVKVNNLLENLEWATYSENSLHAYQTGLNPDCRGENKNSSKLEVTDVIEIFRMRYYGSKLKDIASRFNISEATVCNIYKGKVWTPLTESLNYAFKKELRPNDSTRQLQHSVD